MTEHSPTPEEDSTPDWWAKNQRLREELDLPAYEPSQLEDGAYTHEVVSRLEETYDCSIRLRGKNPQYPCNWSVFVDGDPVVSMERRRTKRGNTIFQLTSTELEDVVRSSVTARLADCVPPREEGNY